MVGAAVGEVEVVGGIEEGEDGLRVAQPIKGEIVDGKLQDLQVGNELQHNFDCVEWDVADLYAGLEEGQELVA